jgi:hypothetical protein
VQYAALDALVLPQLFDVLSQRLGPAATQELVAQHSRTFSRASGAGVGGGAGIAFAVACSIPVNQCTQHIPSYHNSHASRLLVDCAYCGSVLTHACFAERSAQQNIL